jgi:site-specific DNA recombinase
VPQARGRPRVGNHQGDQGERVVRPERLGVEDAVGHRGRQAGPARNVRKGWKEVIDDLSSGVANGLLAVESARLTRRSRDMEDVIDLCEDGKIEVRTCQGAFDFQTSMGRFMAKTFAGLNQQESEDKSARVTAARQRQAAAGAYGGGKRPYGYQADGMTLVAREAAEVLAAVDGVAAGRSLRSLAASLNQRGVPTATGTKWTPETLRDIILRPRNAGIAVYQGKEAGPAKWPAIVEDEDMWRAAVAVLRSPGRQARRGNVPRWHGSCLYRCGKCGAGMGSTLKEGRYQSYVCREKGCTKIGQAPLDALVTEVVLQRLSRPDAAELFAPADDYAARGAELAAEQRRLRSKLDGLVRLHNADTIDDRQLSEGSKDLRKRLTEAERQAAALAPRSPLAGIAGRPDVQDVWDKMSLEQHRAIIRSMMTVTIRQAVKPNGGRPKGRKPGQPYFDRNRAVVTWNAGPASAAA